MGIPQDVSRWLSKHESPDSEYMPFLVVGWADHLNNPWPGSPDIALIISFRVTR